MTLFSLTHISLFPSPPALSQLPSVQLSSSHLIILHSMIFPHSQITLHNFLFAQKSVFYDLAVNPVNKCVPIRPFNEIFFSSPLFSFFFSFFFFFFFIPPLLFSIFSSFFSFSFSFIFIAVFLHLSWRFSSLFVSFLILFSSIVDMSKSRGKGCQSVADSSSTVGSKSRKRMHSCDGRLIEFHDETLQQSI